MEQVYFKPYNSFVELISMNKIEGTVTIEIEGIEFTVDREKIALKEEIFVCSNCGGMNIEHEAWVKTNTNKYVEDLSEPSIFCNDCGEHSDEFIMYDEFHNK